MGQDRTQSGMNQVISTLGAADHVLLGALVDRIIRIHGPDHRVLVEPLRRLGQQLGEMDSRITVGIALK